MENGILERTDAPMPPPTDPTAKYRENLVRHNDAIRELLAAADPQVAAFIRTNFQMHLHPLELAREWIAKLTAFKDAALSAPSSLAPPTWQWKVPCPNCTTLTWCERFGACLASRDAAEWTPEPVPPSSPLPSETTMKVTTDGKE